MFVTVRVNLASYQILLHVAQMFQMVWNIGMSFILRVNFDHETLHSMSQKFRNIEKWAFIGQ
jgi:hypothetical protein